MRNKFISGSLICLSCFLAIPGLAQAQDTVRTLSEVIISANRWEQPSAEVSGRMARLDRDLIVRTHAQTAADLLGSNGQVFIQKSQLGGGSPMLRGFSTSRVMLVVDGVRMNNAIFRSGNLQNVISLDPNFVRESEVLFGPGSVMYGSDAIGGVMDFHLVEPVLADSARFTPGAALRYSSANNERMGHVNLRFRTGKWSLYSGYTHSEFGDLRMGSHGPDEYLRPDYQVTNNLVNETVINKDPRRQIHTGYYQNNVFQKVNYALSEGSQLAYSFYFSATSDVPRYDRLLLRTAQGGLSNAEWYYGPQQWGMHQLRFTSRTPRKLYDEVKVIAAYQDYRESRHNRNYSGGNRLRRTDRFERVKIGSLNADLSLGLTSKTRLFYGAEWITNLVQSTAQRFDLSNSTASPVSTRYPDGSRWNSVGAYGTTRTYLTRNLTLNSGLRFTYVNTAATFDTTFFDFSFVSSKVNNASLNGSLGLVYNLGYHKTYINLATGFRAPNIDDIGKVFDSQPGAVVVPNPNLGPERAWQGELGWQSDVTRPFSIDVAVYYTRLTQAIVRGAFTLNGEDSVLYDGTLSAVLAQQNSGASDIYGIQAGYKLRLHNRLTFSGNVNYQKGKEHLPETQEVYSPTHVAPVFGRLILEYSARNYGASFWSTFQGETSYKNLALSERADAHLYAKDAEGNPFSPSWAILSVKAWWRINGLLVSAELENLTDVRYRPYSSGITAPGRNAVISLRYGF